jgi:ankyrin repeat protein
MADAPKAADLVDQIEAHDASVIAAISALADRCLVDARNRTLFDVAILSDNAGVVSLLASDSDALEFSAPVDEKSKDPIKHTVAMHDVEVPISKLETHLESAFGEDLAYGRTPLHTACRVGNTSAIETLLAAGAKTNAKDAIGLTVPELAYYAHGDKGLRDFIAAFERSSQTELPVGKRLLAETFAFPETMTQLLEVAKLDAFARRLLFCYRCAWLDIDAVRSMLEHGQDPNKGLTAELNPLWEACTSAMLWNEAISGGFEMAYHYTKYTGHPGASSISFDNDLLNEDGSNFGKLFAEAQRKQKSQIKSVKQMAIEPDAEREMINRRIALLDVLLDAGADIALARKKLQFETFSDLKQMGLGDVAARLKQRGGGAAKAPKKRKAAASTFWELVGETGLNTEYWPEEGAGGLLRLILHDVYGPVDGVTLSVRLSRDESKPDGEWRELKPVTETVDVEGEIVSRAELTEPVYGESPWEASYEIPLNSADGANVLWIRLDHKDEEQLCGELDPWTFTKG